MSLENPKDLTVQVEVWLTKSIELAKGSSLPDAILQLQELKVRLESPGFRLAFVGEFNRGKSTLINRLLTRNILPVGTLPTTATLTSIVTGTEDSMEVHFEGGKKKKCPLKEESWQDLLAIDSNGKSQEVFAQVHITLEHPWLKLLDCELIDTPGAGDLIDQRTQILSNFLSYCDGTVFVISATSPFSRTEKVLLDQEIIGRYVPQILVVISMLDRVREAEKVSVIEYITNCIREFSDTIPVLALHPVDNKVTEAEMLEIVRNQIKKMVASGDQKAWRRRWRSQKIARQLEELLTNIINIGKNAIQTAQMNIEERKLAEQKQQNQIQEADTYWEEIRLELEQRRLQHHKKIRQNLLSAKTDLLQNLSVALSQAQDAKSWFEKELPLSLRQELTSLARKSEGFLMKSVGQDFDWVKSSVEERFNINISWELTTAGVPPKINYIPNQLEEDISDLEQYRLLSRLGSSAAMVCSYLVFASVPVAIAVSIGAAGILAFSEKMINSKLKEQQELIARQLESILNQVIDEYCNRLYDHLRLLYSQLIDGTKREQKQWQLALLKTIDTDNDNTDTEVWQNLIQQASNLKQEITNALSY
jgi:GTPase SAR1 family protein